METIIFHELKPRKGKRTLPILHEVEIIYTAPILTDPVLITRSIHCYEILEKVIDKRKLDYKEMFFVLLLNRANYCIGYSVIGVGSTSGVVVNRKEIFQLALITNASGIVVAHNHPSGNLKPSEQDIQITRTLKAGCDLLEMKLLDHLIISSKGYYSMSDDGVL